jgi:hypothetical protein
MAAIWWVLGWYPIRSSFMDATVVGVAVVFGAVGWVQPAVNSKKAITMNAIAMILIGFMNRCCPVNNKKVPYQGNYSLFL